MFIINQTSRFVLSQTLSKKFVHTQHGVFLTASVTENKTGCMPKIKIQFEKKEKVILNL